MADFLSIGIHLGVDEARYHADPGERPSLSSGIGRLLFHRSAKHAWHNHPRLNPDHRANAATELQNLGSALHSILLGKGAPIEEMPFENYRTKEAQAAKASAIADGKIPMKSDEVSALYEIVDAARAQFELMPHVPFKDGNPEAVLLWEDGTSLCRALVDWLPDDPRAPVYDLKTTTKAPDEMDRAMVKDYAFQAAFYRRGLLALRGYAPEFRFVVVETEAPYCTYVTTPDPTLMALAEYQVDEALSAWERAMTSGAWPGYDDRIRCVEAPRWALDKMTDHQIARKPSLAQIAQVNQISQQIGAPLS
jgi:hypothetical protein